MLSENQTTPSQPQEESRKDMQAMTGGFHLSGAKDPMPINDDQWKHRGAKII